MADKQEEPFEKGFLWIQPTAVTVVHFKWLKQKIKPLRKLEACWFSHSESSSKHYSGWIIQRERWVMHHVNSACFFWKQSNLPIAQWQTLLNLFGILIKQFWTRTFHHPQAWKPFWSHPPHTHTFTREYAFARFVNVLNSLERLVCWSIFPLNDQSILL